MTLPIGRSFQNAETVDLYMHRPPYPSQLYDLLKAHAPGTDNILDLGCGHGKIARYLTPHFKNITAIDPSARMIELGKSLENGQAENLIWIEGYAETVPLSATYDVIVAALSIHWMDHAQLFPKLLHHAKPNHVFAVIHGDAPYHPPWQEGWDIFLEKWVPKVTGKPFIKDYGKHFWNKYLQYVDVTDEFNLISEPVRQSIDDFILCEHSRDTFSISKLGTQRAQFDAELAEILHEHADENGQLTFKTSTRLTLSKILH